MRNFKDESFISQYLSPRLMREFRLFAVADYVADEEALRVDSIHDERGYRRLRKLLAQQHAQEIRVPDVQVVRFDRDGDRSLTLRHLRRRGRPLTGSDCRGRRCICDACGASPSSWKRGRTTRASATSMECPA